MNKVDQKSKRRAHTRPATPAEVERGLDFLNDYFASLKANVKISTKSSESEGAEDNEIIFQLTGDLKPIKHNPQQLAALTRLTSMAMSANSRQLLRCAIDLEGQLSARRALLEVIADDAAAVAKHTHKRAIIEGLNAYERRKVHHFINRDEDVETLSNGEGEFRYMMVAIKT